MNPRHLERVASAGTTTLGLVLVVSAAAAGQHWLDRHFLPSFFLPRPWYVLLETAVRLFIAFAGVSILIVRRNVVCVLARAPRTVLSVAIAAVLALVASEWALRHVHLRPTEWLAPQEEPLRTPDAMLGWVLRRSRTGSALVGGRRVEYAIDAAGYRVRGSDAAVDPARSTVIFIGESVMFGEGLTWEETIPAVVGRMLGVQSANLAVHGYSNDQAYLRLDRELPRFSRPVAVVSLFMVDLFGRNLDDDRPHLDPGLVWVPAVPSSRLQALASLLVPYRTTATVDRGVAVTREVLRATAHLARERGAKPLVVVPQFGPEDGSERALRQRIIDDDVPSLVVPLDAAWRLPWDRHPNAYADHVIAAAIAARLRQP